MNLNKETAEWQSLFSVAPAESWLIFVVYHAIVYILIKAVIGDKQKQNNNKKKENAADRDLFYNDMYFGKNNENDNWIPSRQL